MTTWEYQSFMTNGPGLEEALNTAGKQGWEAVSVTATTYRYRGQPVRRHRGDDTNAVGRHPVPRGDEAADDAGGVARDDGRRT